MHVRRQPTSTLRGQPPVRAWLGILVATLAMGCADQSAQVDTSKPFTQLPSSFTGVDFRNDLAHDDEFNIYTYRNFYNGGGVGVGDVNGDGLPDLYLTANMTANRLYLNRGGMRFEDVTEAAGVAGTRGWSTGVALADVNADGHLDVYVCNSGQEPGAARANELFINDGRGTFREAAAELGLDDTGLSTHAAFFDYDRDGDLDVYLLNNSFNAIGSFNLRKRLRPVRDSVGGDKLYRNMLAESGTAHFEDVSEEAGILGSVIGFGLGVTAGDVDLDGWTDLYISNDFFERDYLYINQRDGTFAEVLEDRITSTSAASMGADMADVNGDGYPEIFVTDMLPASDRRLKLNTTFESWDNYRNKLDNGYYHQFTRNTLQQNRGDGTFSEVGRSYGLEASDWSWGALLVDLDTDGDRDVFVANGIYQDLTNQDYIQFLSSSETVERVTASGTVDFGLLVDLIPSEPVANVVFENIGSEDSFLDSGSEFGLDAEGFSNGAAYGDLDGDGDLDLVVNNVNGEAWIYRNDAPRDSLRNSLRLTLVGEGLNTFGVGARISARCGAQIIAAEQIPTRGFQSSVEPLPFLGLGSCTSIDTVRVFWPSGKTTELYEVPAGQLTVYESEATPGKDLRDDPAARRYTLPAYRSIKPAAIGIDYVHEESTFADWDRERLVFQATSSMGPCLGTGDLNGDGLEDLVVGGGPDQAAAVYLQTESGKLRRQAQPALELNAKTEDTDLAIFDADQDGDLDVLIVAGSPEFSAETMRRADRLYLNPGNGVLERAPASFFPNDHEISSCIAVGDANADGFPDVFIGSRQVQRLYGVSARSRLLLGSPNGYTELTAPLLDTLGMVTDAAIADVDGDGNEELIVTRDWASPTVLSYASGTLVEVASGLSTYPGLWSTLLADDVDGDGDVDLVAGNHGLNSRLRASSTQPASMLVGDFDGNGTAEQITSRYLDGASLPLTLRHDLIMQLPSLKKKYLKYDSYHGQRVDDIFTPEQLDAAIERQVSELRSGYFINDGAGVFTFLPFPMTAQTSITLAATRLQNSSPLPQTEEQIVTAPPQYLLAGNLYTVKPEFGRHDASVGYTVQFSDSGAITASAHLAGLRLEGEVRDFATLRMGDEDILIVARNNASPLVYASNRASSPPLQ